MRKKKEKKTETTKVETEVITVEVPKLPDTPPHKGKDPIGWKNWYKETIKNKINENKSLDDIAKELGIRIESVNYFLK